MKIMKKLIKACTLLVLASLGSIAQAQTVTYLHTDALGTPIAVTDAAGNIIETSEYSPYGDLLNRSDSDGPGYTGHVQDAATGMTYMQQRYYDPQLGLFLSVDPVSAYSNPVLFFSRYRYANNNPLSYLDPDGRAPGPRGLGDECDLRPCRRTSNNPRDPDAPFIGPGAGRGRPTPKGKSPGPWRDGYVAPKKTPTTYEQPAPSKSKGGTLQIGIHGSASEIALGEAGFGLAISDREIGHYTTYSAGVGPKADVNVSIVITFSNADSIADLGGGGRFASAGGGFLGHAELSGEVSNNVPGQKQIYSGSLAIGVGAGGGASAGWTETQVEVWRSYED